VKQGEFKKLADFSDKSRPALVALVSEARANPGNVDYAVDATLSLILIAAYGVFLPKEKEQK
jgi:hypothetical protein